MAKNDWNALQSQFENDTAKSGISPKDWCEAKGLNYQTARRYIKVRKTAQNVKKKLRKIRRMRRNQHQENQK
ncbi:hypothetical protein [Vibrio salinus]|uniref:hypothetical protein n=1 Tax=Vibrio salinus TaxID=2899784 RepID=UPI001E3D8E18|nr:hypothetical protein [Vibrio salinus]MCE0495763.1 hypothetical protein [Vibrio salinus]